MILTDFLKTYSLSIIWLVFTALFLYMAWREWSRSKKPLSSLKSAFFNKQNTGITATIKITGIDFEDFAKELEKSNQESHKIAATAYFLAGLTALASLAFSFL